MQTPFWSGGTIAIATQCTLCHIYENVASRAAATQYNSAITGVHAVTTTVSGQNHSVNAQATCGGAVSCHTGVPTNHLGANLDDSAMIELTTATAGLRAGITVATGPSHDPNLDTCALSCHKEGAKWARLNDRTKSTALITDTAQVCDTCHGTTATGWVTGVTLSRPNMTGVGGPGLLTGSHEVDWNGDGTSAEVASNHGTCKTCHGMNATTDANTNYLTGTTVGAFWNPAGATGFHGNGSIDMNGPSAAINAANNATPIGAEYNGNDDATLESSDFSCTAACHAGAANASHQMGDSTTWAVKYGDYGKGSCDGCHGGGTTVGLNKNYWPDGSNTNAENHAKRHPVHITRLALARYNENITQLLTDNGNGTASAKQVELCTYCHTSPGADGDHGVAANLPAEVNVFYNLWLPKTLDNGVWAVAGGGTCAASNCHLNKTTTNTAGIDFSWNGNTTTNTTACVMCHADIQNTGVATGLTHQAHVTSLTSGGNVCSDCHAATTWGTPGTAPASGHINGTFAVGGTVSFTYSGTFPTVGTCGINLCHNNGQSTNAILGYTWGTAIGATNSCTECHGATSSTLATNSHGPHLTTLTGAGAVCNDCHATATVATHANGSVTFAATFTYTPAAASAVAVNGGTFGTCGINLCHNNGQSASAILGYTWNTAIGATNSCTECHGATSSTLATNSHGPHLTTLTGAGAVCNDCHATATVATHANGSVTFSATFTYTPAGASAVAVNGGTFGTCGINLCHNNGQSANGDPRLHLEHGDRRDQQLHRVPRG